MRVSNITYARTFNLGDYESMRLEATVELEESEDPALAWELAKAEVAAQAKPVLNWRDKRRALDAEHVIDGLPAHLREPVRAMVSTTMGRVDHNGNGKE